MEDAVDDDAVELFIVGGALLLGIGAHGVEADEEVACDGVFLAGEEGIVAVVEGDDVGVVVVLQILTVHLKYFFVVAEDVADVPHPLSVGGCHGFNPCTDLAATDGWHLHAIDLVCDHDVIIS